MQLSGNFQFINLKLKKKSSIGDIRTSTLSHKSEKKKKKPKRKKKKVTLKYSNNGIYMIMEE